MKYLKSLPKEVTLHLELEPLMRDFYKSREDDVQALKLAIKNDDWKEIKKRGHILYGVCGSYGMSDLGQLGRSLEETAKSMNKEEVVLIVDAINTYMKQVKIMYK